jgi:hypothetical protein
MSSHAKSVSVRHLQAAVKTALDAARKDHPGFRLAPAIAAEQVELIYRPWVICGLPIPWPWEELGNPETVQFVTAFTRNLASDSEVAALGMGGKFEPAVYLAGEQASIGFVPGNAPIRE